MNKTARLAFVLAMAAVQVAADALLAFPSWDWTQAKANLQSEQHKQEQKDKASRETLKDAPKQSTAVKETPAAKRAKARRKRSMQIKNQR